MSTSFVAYHGKGFWSWDGYLEDALAVIVAGIDPVSSADWLRSARQHWTEQASGGFMGCIFPNLDEFLTTKERQGVFLRTVGSVVGQDDLTPEARDTLLMLAALVRGEIQTDASSPLDYMISGEFRRMKK